MKKPINQNKMNEKESKALFFAQYIAADPAQFTGNSVGILSYATYGDCVKYALEKRWLQLRSVSDLTDEEKVIISNRMQIYPEDVIDWINGDCGHVDFENLYTWLPCYDLLRSFGILLPFTYLTTTGEVITLQPDEILQMGWAKLSPLSMQ